MEWIASRAQDTRNRRYRWDRGMRGERCIWGPFLVHRLREFIPAWQIVYGAVSIMKAATLTTQPRGFFNMGRVS